MRHVQKLICKSICLEMSWHHSWFLGIERVCVQWKNIKRIWKARVESIYVYLADMSVGRPHIDPESSPVKICKMLLVDRTLHEWGDISNGFIYLVIHVMVSRTNQFKQNPKKVILIYNIQWDKMRKKHINQKEIILKKWNQQTRWPLNQEKKKKTPQPPFVFRFGWGPPSQLRASGSPCGPWISSEECNKVIYYRKI